MQSGEKKLRRFIDDTDKGRASFVGNDIFSVDVADPKLYDLVIQLIEFTSADAAAKLNSEPLQVTGFGLRLNCTDFC